jgi:hypothetical protein
MAVSSKKWRAKVGAHGRTARLPDRAGYHLLLVLLHEHLRIGASFNDAKSPMKNPLLTAIFRFCLLVGGLGITPAITLAIDIPLQPGDSLDQARDKARSGDRIILHGGTYRLDHTLVLKPENSGVTWMAAPGEQPILSGGIPVTNWTRDTDGVWKAPLVRTAKLRQLYVNGVPAKMAELKHQVQGRGGYGQFIVKGNEPWAFTAGQTDDGVRVLKSDLPSVAHPEDLEIRGQTTWSMNRFDIRGIKDAGDSWILLFDQPAGAMAEHQNWVTFDPAGGLAVFNAREFLTEPGEFYFDRAGQILYYMPRIGEEMNHAEVIAPVLETVVSIQGRNLRQHVFNVRFEGITFRDTAWQMMHIGNSYGAVGIQSCALTVKFGSPDWHENAYQTTDVPVAAVEVNSADHIAFTGDDFRLIGDIGLNMENDVHDSLVEGNIFLDIGSCSINVGHPQHVYIGKQNGFNGGRGPYHIDNSRAKWNDTVEGRCTGIEIANNLIRRTGLEHPPSVALSVFYGHVINIDHNDLRYAPYSGIGLGWGWVDFDGEHELSMGKPSLSLEDNAVRGNRLTDMLQTLEDGGGIYLLGMSEPLASDPSRQKWSEVSGNYLHDFGGDMRSAIHPDGGARFFYFHDNVFDNMKWSLIKVSDAGEKGDFRVERNYANTTLFWSEGNYPIAPRTTIRDNVQISGEAWPPEAQQIIDTSGLQPAYKGLFDRIPKDDR